jgi:uncharacterized protein (TIGR02996 family)
VPSDATHPSDTPEGRAFLREICAHPDDDAPRLVYADWLDERGDPLGEFIRVSIGLDRTPADAPGYAELHARMRRLRYDNEDWWVNPLRALGGTETRVRRGFVESVTVELEAFLNRFARFFEAAPIRRLRLHRGRTNMALLDMTRLGQVPQLSRLRELVLSDLDITDDELSRLLAGRHLRHLESLDLERNRITTAGARLLLTTDALPALRTLWLYGQGLVNNPDVGPALEERFGWEVFLDHRP